MDKEIITYLEQQTGRESDLFKFMTTEIPVDNDPLAIAEAKKMAAHSDALSVQVSDWTRRLSVYKDSREIELVTEYRQDCLRNDIKPSATGQEAYVRTHLSQERRWKEYLERLQIQLKDRVILVNSLLKNSSVEDRTMATNKVIERSL